MALRAVCGEFHPIADRVVLRLASAPDIAFFNGVLDESLTGRIDNADGALRGDLEGLVVRAIFLGLLRHQADVRHRAHRAWIEGAVSLAELDYSLVDARVAAVGYDGEGIPKLAFSVPHLSRGTNHRGHGSVDDHIAGDVKVSDSFVGIHHCQGGPFAVGRLDVCLDLGPFIGRKALNLRDEVAEAVVEVHAQFTKGGTMLGDEVLEKDPYRVAENDRIGDLHHRRLHVQREKKVLILCFGHLLLEKGEKGFFSHRGGIKDFAGLERGPFLEHRDFSIVGDELDLHVGRFGHGDGFFVREEIIAAHRANFRL